MNEGTRSSLDLKLAANYARRERERFLSTLPVDLAVPLESADFVVPPESDPVVSRFCIEEGGVGYPPRFVPSGYIYQAFSWAEPMLAAAGFFPDTFDSLSAYLRPHGDLPLFRVSFGWARTHFRALFPFTPNGLAVISESLEVALISDHYSGHLDDVATDDETVYELAWWYPTKTIPVEAK